VCLAGPPPQKNTKLLHQLMIFGSRGQSAALRIACFVYSRAWQQQVSSDAATLPILQGLWNMEMQLVPRQTAVCIGQCCSTKPAGQLNPQHNRTQLLPKSRIATSALYTITPALHGRLCPCRYRVFTLDLRGHGSSTTVDDANLSAEVTTCERRSTHGLCDMIQGLQSGQDRCTSCTAPQLCLPRHTA
jgi:hypothetical protein